MNVAVDSWIASDILNQLQRLNELHHAAQPFIDDYREVHQQSQIFEVEVGHLKKQVESLHEEVEDKDGQLRSVEEKAWKIAQAEKFESERNRVREENESIKAQMSEMTTKMDGMAKAKESMQSEKEQAMLDLAAAYSHIQNLETRVDELEKELANEIKAREIAVEEHQANNERVEECMQLREGLESDNRCLKTAVDRLTKEREDAMNEVFKLQSDMQEKAKWLARWEKEIKELEQTLTKKKGPLLFPPWLWGGGKQHNRTSSDPVACAQPPPSPPQISDSDPFVILGDKDLDNEEKVVTTECRVPRSDFKASQSHPKGCTGVAFLPTDGSIVATCGDDGSRMLWNPASRGILKTLNKVVEGGVVDVAFTCNGDHLLAACRDKSVRVSSFRGQPVILTGHRKGVNCVACSPADAQRAVSSGEDNNIIMWSLERNGYQLASQHVDRKALAVCYNREGNIILSGHKGGAVRLWDVRSRELCVSTTESTVHSNYDTVGLCSFPHCNNLFLSAGRDNRLCVLDLRYMDGLHQVEEYSRPNFIIGTFGYNMQGSCGLGISPDGNFLAAGSVDGRVLVWNRKEEGHRQLEQPLQSEHHKGAAVVACAWSPSENQLVSGDNKGGVVFWEDRSDVGMVGGIR